MTTPRAHARRPLRATPLNLSLLSLLGLLSMMSPALVVNTRPLPPMESWRDLYEGPADFGTSLARATSNGRPLLYESLSLGVATLPGYTWGKGALLFALSSTSSGQRRLNTPLVCAIIIFACEQFVDTVMYYVGSQPPSTTLYGYRLLTQRLNRVIPRGATLSYVGVKRFRDAYGAPYASHDEAGQVNFPLSTPRRAASTLRPSIRPWGSLVDLEDSSLGPMPRVKILSSKAGSWDWLVAKEKSFVA